mmetsp:Transcript_6224/g.5589  ORF Transcript_6224/g.5589 Transcript_6224/m.5589 type:complete len:118 (+) Transcript_6224:983-1336(+)
MNISMIMDCISCEKCRLNGKVQMVGLGAALKVLFYADKGTSLSTLKLKRTEIIALMNLLQKSSESLLYFEEFLEMEFKYYKQLRIGQGILLFLFLTVLMDLVYKGYVEERKEKVKKE